MTEVPGRLRVFAYLNADKASLYRAVMRVFVDAKGRFTLHLRPHEVESRPHKIEQTRLINALCRFAGMAQG